MLFSAEIIWTISVEADNWTGISLTKIDHSCRYSITASENWHGNNLSTNTHHPLKMGKQGFLWFLSLVYEAGITSWPGQKIGVRSKKGKRWNTYIAPTTRSTGYLDDPVSKTVISPELPLTVLGFSALSRAPRELVPQQIVFAQITSVSLSSSFLLCDFANLMLF